jgi:hypothetical protein
MLGCSKQVVSHWLAVPRRATLTLERGLKLQELLKKTEELTWPRKLRFKIRAYLDGKKG